MRKGRRRGELQKHRKGRERGRGIGVKEKWGTCQVAEWFSKQVESQPHWKEILFFHPYPDSAKAYDQALRFL